MSNGTKMPDGTVCYSGPTCKRHGLIATLNKQILEAKKNPSPKAIEASIFPLARSIRRGLNSSDNSQLKALDAEAEAFYAVVDEEESDAIKGYTMNHYSPINSYLRDGDEGLAGSIRSDSHREPRDGEIAHLRSFAENWIPKLDSAFSKHVSLEKKARVLYKAFRVRPPHSGIPTTAKDVQAYIADNYKVGEIITNKAYNSTSADSDYMLAFCRRRNSEVIVHEIVTSSGIPIHRSEEGNMDNITDAEREILLPRNMKLKVVNITRGTYESSYPEGRPSGLFFSSVPKRKTFTVIQMIEIQ